MSVHRSFIQFILEPIYKIFAHTVGEIDGTFRVLCKELSVNLNKSEFKMNVVPVLTLFCKQFFGSFAGFVDVVSKFIPSPFENTDRKITHLYTGDINTQIGESLLNCDPSGPLLVHIAKLYPTSDGLAFHAFGRVFSGTCI